MMLLLICLALLGNIDIGLATVNCTSDNVGDIRLTGPDNNQHTVQLCSFNTYTWFKDGRQLTQSFYQWTYISTVGWTDTTTEVACRLLHLPYSGIDAESFSIRRNAATLEIGDCTGILMGGSLLGVCPLAHTDLVRENTVTGINCTADVCSHGEIRLVNGTTNREGRVEVCRDIRWGTVCSLPQRKQTARVVCRQLGFPSEGASLDRFGEGRGDSFCFACSGNEDMLTGCTDNGPFSDDHSYDIGVRCKSHDEVINKICPSNSTPLVLVTTKTNQCIAPTVTVTKTNNECSGQSQFNNIIMESSKPLCSSTPTLGQAIGNTTTGATISNTMKALGALSGVLVVVLIVVIMGWILTCVVVGKKSKQTKQGHDVNTEGFAAQLDNPVYDVNSPPLTNYSSLGPANETTGRDEGAVYSYAVVDRSHGNNHRRSRNTESAIISPTPDYNVLDHTRRQDRHDNQVRESNPQEPVYYDLEQSNETGGDQEYSCLQHGNSASRDEAEPRPNVSSVLGVGNQNHYEFSGGQNEFTPLEYEVPNQTLRVVRGGEGEYSKLKH